MSDIDEEILDLMSQLDKAETTLAILAMEARQLILNCELVTDPPDGWERLRTALDTYAPGWRGKGEK